MNKQILITVIIIVLLAAGGYLWYSMANTAQAPTDTQLTGGAPQTESPLVDVEVETIPVAMTHQVTYTDSGYSPATLTIKAGDTVTFKNQSSANMWTASAMHPGHMVYDGTSLQQHCPNPTSIAFDQCTASQPSTSWSFTFTKIGEWGYHNHSKSNHFGKIIVE